MIDAIISIQIKKLETQMTQVIQTEFITASDLIQYQNHSIPYGPIGEVVDTRTYLRWLPELQRRETALERWQRVINYNLNLAYNQHSYQWLRDEGLLMLDRFVNLKADVSGRTKWVGGTESSLNNPQSNFNCSFSIINRLSVFGEIFGLLMNGCGVGFRVFSDDIKNLPKVTNKVTLEFDKYQPLMPEMREEHTYYYFEGNTKYIEVGDSKQGWIDALNHYLDVITIEHREADTVHFNLDSIRPLGERIKGFGGTASGPDALKGIIEDINRIVNESNEALRSIDCMDIVCAIAKGVVAGSSRRSALISLFEQGDTLMSNAKVGLYTNPELAYKSYRSQSNNTVCLSSKPTLDEIKSLLDTCRTEGEPGFNNYYKMIQKRVEAAKKYRPENPIEWYTNVGTNPCFAAGTMVLTREGHYPIETLVGKTVTVHDGNDWVEVDNFRVTGNDQDVYKVTLHSGQSITATAYHNFVLEDGTVKELRHLIQGDKLLINTTAADEGFIHLDSAYLKGFLVGDGTQSDGKPVLHLYHPKYICENRLIESASETVNVKRYGTYEKFQPTFTDPNGNYKCMRGLSVRRDDFLPWVTNYRKCLPTDCLNWDNQSKYEFIAGVLDADGTASDTRKGFMYQIVSVNFEFLESFQLLLKSIGISSRLSSGQKRDGLHDFGEDRGGICIVKDSYRITISQPDSIKLASLVKFNRLTDFSHKSTVYNVKSNFSKVVSVEFSHVADDVYCCTVPTNHRFTLSNSLVVGQCHEIILSGGKDGDSVSFCNLTTLPLPNFVYSLDGINLFDMVEFEESLRLNTRISMRQTCVAFDNPKWSETQSDERLLGVSMTGCQDMFSMMGWKTGCEEINTFLTLANEFANDEADRYSKVLEIPRPLLVTSLKPEGTSSTIYGTSSGLHWDWAPYYIRRVRMTSKDALAVTLLNQGFTAYPELYDLSRLFDDPSLTDWDRLSKFSNLEPMERLSYLGQCSTVVFEFPCKSNSLQTQEDISAIEQLESLRAFTNVYTDHMPSSTISIKDNEWDAVAEWIDTNWDEYITASFFPYFGGAYPLLPLEAITSDVYDQMISKIPSSNIKVLPSGKVTFVVDHNLLTEVERSIGKLTDEDLGSDCAKGVCPIR